MMICEYLCRGTEKNHINLTEGYDFFFSTGVAWTQGTVITGKHIKIILKVLNSNAVYINYSISVFRTIRKCSNEKKKSEQFFCMRSSQF